MKNVYFLCILLAVTPAVSKAQFYKSVLPSAEFNGALEKIVLDFRTNFSNIKGEAIDLHGDIDTYASAIELPGAENCVIMYFHSEADTTASWQATTYNGDDFKEAAKAYENLFRLVKKSKIKWVDKSLVGFTGELIKPKEELRFAMTTLDFDGIDARYKKFKADIEMINNYNGWVVRLNLQNKKPDTEGVPGR